MALLDLWQTSPDQVRDKHVQQLIVFAGAGKLLDGSAASDEFRAFLSHVPSQLLKRYAEECLAAGFADGGLALQDLINEVGARIGAAVTRGRYRGSTSAPAFDGLWKFPGGHSIVVEVKTTDTYRIDLDRIAAYRRSLIEQATISEEESSILLIVGRQDTGDLEAQIRGSRHAWDVRLLSIDSLFALLAVKERVDDPASIQRIHRILIPREFTRLDEIVDIVFSTAEDVKEEELTESTEATEEVTSEQRSTPVDFHEACIERIQRALGKALLKRTRVKFSSPDESTAVVCAVSKEHITAGQPNYWFAFHPHQQDFLDAAAQAYVAFGCGSSK